MYASLILLRYAGSRGGGGEEAREEEPDVREQTDRTM